jgi:hypothetical protein
VQTKNTRQLLTYVFLFIIDPNKEKNGLEILHLSNEENFLTPQKMLRYMGGHPTPFTSSKEAFLPNESVPSSVLLGPNPEETRNTTNEIVGDPSYAIEVMVKIESEGEEHSYVPSTGSKTLLSSCSYEDEDTTEEPSERDPEETVASAVKALFYEEEKKPLLSDENDGRIKCGRCRCVPCIWIQKGHLVQMKHKQAVKKALCELATEELPNWHLRRLYFAEMAIQMWGPLGWERKTVLPECVVDSVRGLFPEPNGIYNYPKWS